MECTLVHQSQLSVIDFYEFSVLLHQQEGNGPMDSRAMVMTTESKSRILMANNFLLVRPCVKAEQCLELK